jgi:hypothetical protein
MVTHKNAQIHLLIVNQSSTEESRQRAVLINLRGYWSSSVR